MIRPEAAATLNRLREVLAGLLLAGMGGYFLARPGYVLPALGFLLVLLGAGLAVVGLRRIWFRAKSDGPGVVQVVEGQIGFFGPEGGGFLALDDLERLELTADGAAWQLTGTGGEVLVIPRGARGAEDLLDAFVRLPGLDTSAVVRAASAGSAAAGRQIWRRAPAGPALPRR